MTRELLQQALEALQVRPRFDVQKWIDGVCLYVPTKEQREVDIAIAALEATLAQPAQPATTREAFEAWYEDNRFPVPTQNEADIAQQAWQAATAHEREACEFIADYNGDMDTAAAIRARSNE